MAGQTSFPNPQDNNPADLQTHLAYKASDTGRLADMVSANPKLNADPASAHAMLQVQGLDGHTAGMATKFMQLYANAHKGIGEAVGGSGNNPAKTKAGGFFANAFGGIEKAWNWFANEGVNDGSHSNPVGSALQLASKAATGITHGVTNWFDNFHLGPQTSFEVPKGADPATWQPPTPTTNVKNDLEATLTASSGLANWVNNTKNRALTTAAEVLTGGQIGASQTQGPLANVLPGWTWGKGNVANLDDAYHSAANAIVGVGDALNPFKTYNNMAHFAAFYESLAKRRGASYALSYLLPYLAISMVTHSAIMGPAATEAADLAASATAEGATITPEEQALIKEAKTETKTSPMTMEQTPSGAIPKIDIPESAIRGSAEKGATKAEEAAADAAQQASRGKRFQFASDVAGVVTKPLKPFMSVANKLMMPGQDLRLNMMYLTAHAGISQDPDLSGLWNQTSNGVPVDDLGRPIGSVGSVMANYLGLDHGAFFEAIAKPIDVYANYFGSDPLGAVGSVVGKARTMEGLGGPLGNLFGGMGIRSGEDVYRVTQQYSRVARAFQWMADHNAGQIADRFRGLFPGEAGAKIISKLGEAQTLGEVQAIWADMAEGIGFLKNEAPSMTMYEFTKAKLMVDGSSITLGDAMNADIKFNQQIENIAKEETPFPFPKPDSTNYIVGEGEVLGRIRSRQRFGQWAAGQLRRAEAYISEETGRWENFTIHPGSKNAIPAIMDSLLKLGVHRTVVDTIGSSLLTASKQEYVNVVRSAYYHAIMRRVTAGMSEATFDSVKVGLEQDVFKEVMRMTGADGASEEAGSMVNGIEGGDRSQTPKPGNIITNSALGDTQLGTLHFPRARDMKGFASRLREIALQLTPAEDLEASIAARLSVKSLEQIAEFRNAVLDGIPKAFEEGIATKNWDASAMEIRPEITDWNAEATRAITNRNNLVKEIEDRQTSLDFSREKFPDEVAALESYTSVWGNYAGGSFDEVNQVLRQSEFLESDIADQSAETAQRIQSLIKSTAPLVDSVMTYRGLSVGLAGEGSSAENYILGLKDLKPGETFTEDGFSSTSFDRGIAQSFTERGGEKLMVEIVNQPGTQGLFVENVFKHEADKDFPTTVSEEKEFILPFGAKFKVLGVVPSEETVNGIHVLRVAHMPEEVGIKAVSEIPELTKVSYATKSRELAEYTKNAMSMGEKLPGAVDANKSFVQVYDAVRTQADHARAVSELYREHQTILKDFDRGVINADEYRVLSGQLDHASPDPSIRITQMTPENMHTLMGEKHALDDAMTKLTVRLQGNAIDEKALIQHVRDYEEAVNNVSNIDEKATAELAKKLGKLRKENPRYRNTFQAAVDAGNWYVSKIFAPMALFSGGWAERVGTSEFILNWLRQGAQASLQAKVLTSYLKHEAGGGALSSAVEGKINNFLQRDLFKGTFKDMLKRNDLGFDQKLASSFGRFVASTILEARDIAGGVFHGIEGNVINWDARTERMVENFSEAMLDFGRNGLPMHVHSQTVDIFDSDITAARMAYGDDGHGNTTISNRYENASFRAGNAGDKNYITGLRGAIGRLYTDNFLRPATQDMRDLLIKYGRENSTDEQLMTNNEYRFLRRGVNTVKTDTEAEALMQNISRTAFDTIESMPASELERFDRHLNKSKVAKPDEEVYATLSANEKARVDVMNPRQRQIFYAHKDWADNIAYHVFHTVAGRDATGAWKVHAQLVEQAGTGQVKNVADLENDVKRFAKSSEPRGIAMEALSEGSGKRRAMAANFLTEVSNKGHAAILGPIVNTYVRDHNYLMIYDQEMEKLRASEEAGIIDHESAKAKAHEATTIKMSKFVHNPLDKTVLEQNMRVVAPFYFAQNQAWRRALRMFRDDPGAFEKYMRFCLATTNFVSVQASGSGGGIVNVPGTEFMGALAGLGTGFGSDMLGKLSMGLAVDPGSVSSIIPTGSEAGMGILGSMMRPAVGPLISLPLKEISNWLGLAHVPLANKVVQGILGPISANSTLFSELVPSTIARNTIDLTAAIFNQNSSSFGSANIYVINNAVDNLSKKIYGDYYNKLVKAGMSTSQAATYARAATDQKVAQDMSDPKFRDEFMHQAHMAAVFLYAVKAVIGFGAPFATSVQQQFSMNPQFQQLLNETKKVKQPNGTFKDVPVYTFEQAATEFANKYPNHIYDIVSHTMSKGSSYSETTSALDLLQNHYWVAKQYPYAAAYLVNRSTSYSPQAYQLELAAGLRARYAPDQYYNQLQIANGNDFYYNWLKKEYPTEVNGQPIGGKIGYENYKALTNAAKQYGRLENPIWYASFEGGNNTFYNEGQAIKQMTTMLADPNVPNSVFGGTQNRSMYKDLIDAYDVTVAEYKGAGSSKVQSIILQGWYNEMTKAAEATDSSGNPIIAPALSYFMTSVLRNLPTKQEQL